MEKGLSSKEAKEKLQTFGRNEIVTKEKISILSSFLSQFPTFINGILAIAAIFALIITDVLDGIFIFAILILNALFGFFQEYRAEKALQKLKSFISPLSRVIRDGKEAQIPTSEIVPGDLVIVFEGDRIPADGYILSAHHIEIDESLLTGESLPVIKKQKDAVLLGTLTIKGKGQIFVEKTGMNTRFGQIAQTLSKIETDKAPLQQKLDFLGKMLSVLAITISLLLIPIGLWQNKPLFPLILLAISIGIAAIPEGLPAIITISLAIGVNRMAKNKAIVRKMAAVETLGSVQIILSDKTGTLTQNTMRVKKCFAVDDKFLPSILQASVLGNTASLIQKEDGDSTWDVIGDKTDGALLLWAQSLTKDMSLIKKTGKIIDEYVFDPQTKTVTTVWTDGRKRYVFVRGAPEILLEKSALTKKDKDKFKLNFEQYAKEGLRVIAFAKKAEAHMDSPREHLESNLEFLGFVGIYDPPRIEAKLALEQAKKAGIRTVMVTGDNTLTALAIARELNLIEKDEDVITSDELRELSDEQLKKILPRIRIFARAKPEDKLRLVALYKKLGFVVGVTGDGVNDALALKRADVGIAMGESGTDVAKEASDIVLADDNFSTLIKAVEEGRKIYDNILKSITYLLSGNLAELSLVFFATILGMPSPLLPTQILWINLVTDGLPALALASDTKDSDLLERDPRNPQNPIMTRNRWLFIACIGFSLSILLIFIFKYLLTISSETFARTVTFNLLVLLHISIAFVVRKNGIFRVNKFLILSIIFTIIIQIIITTVPFFQTIFHLGLR